MPVRSMLLALTMACIAPSIGAQQSNLPADPAAPYEVVRGARLATGTKPLALAAQEVQVRAPVVPAPAPQAIQPGGLLSPLPLLAAGFAVLVFLAARLRP